MAMTKARALKLAKQEVAASIRRNVETGQGDLFVGLSIDEVSDPDLDKLVDAFIYIADHLVAD